MFLVLSRYFPAPGQADALLDVRLRLSAGLRAAGLTGGQVGRRRRGEYPPGSPRSDPDVLQVWTYQTIEEIRRVILIELGSAAFMAVVEEQRQQLDRFEREGYEIIDPRPAIVATNRYYAKPGMAERVLATRLRGNAILAALGLSAGYTGMRHGSDVGGVAPEGAAPHLVWLATFPSMDTYEREAEGATRASDLRELTALHEQLLDGCRTETYTIVDT